MRYINLITTCEGIMFRDDFNDPDRYSIEPHGPEGQFALYFGRGFSKHGFRLCNITESDENIRNLIELALNKTIIE